MLTRRQFTNGSAALVSGGLVGGLIGAHFAKSASGHFNRHLPIPPLIDAAKQENAVKLKVTNGRHAFIEGKPTKSYGYSVPVLGPAIRLRRGDEVEMTVENALDVDTTVHWHGLLGPGDVDGGPHQIIKSGSTWRPRLKIEQPASTAWFHPHLHHNTARQVYMGLTGLIIVDDGSDARLGLPHTYGIDDLPIILQDRSFESDGSLLLYDLDPLTIQYGLRGTSIIANGTFPCDMPHGQAVIITRTAEILKHQRHTAVIVRKRDGSRRPVGVKFGLERIDENLACLLLIEPRCLGKEECTDEVIEKSTDFR